MGLPTIASYPMPTADDLVRGVPPWRPDPGRAALLIHDMQGHFVDALPDGRPPTTELLRNVARLRATAYRLRLPVVYTGQPGPMTARQRGLLLDLWGPGMGAEPWRRRFVPGLTPGGTDLVVTKLRYSAFHRTPLATWLAARGRDQLVVCGVYAHLGCLITAYDAVSHDIETFLVADAVADFNRRDHLMALEYAARGCAVPLTTDQLLAAFGPPELPADEPDRSGWHSPVAGTDRGNGAHMCPVAPSVRCPA